MRKDASDVKRERLTVISQEIAKTIKQGRTVSSVSSWVQYNMGLSQLRAKEYIELVCEMHDWQIQEDGMIKPAKA